MTLLIDVDPTTSECVNATPTTRYVKQFEMADAFGQRRINHEMIAERFETQHCPQQE